MYFRSPSVASGLQIKPVETVAPGAGPGSLRKRNKDPQSRVVGGPPHPAPQNPALQSGPPPSQGRPQSGPGGNTGLNVPSDDMSGGYQGHYYSESSGPSPDPQGGNYQDDSGNWGNSGISNSQSRISNIKSSHNFRQNQAQQPQQQQQQPPQQQQRRNVPMGDQLNQQPASHRTLSSNSSQGEDGNWNSPQMADISKTQFQKYLSVGLPGCSSGRTTLFGPDFRRL